MRAGRAPARAAAGREGTVLDFDVEVTAEGGCAIVVVRGELDLASAPQLAHALEQAQATAGRVVVNLLRTTFVDSTGLATLLRAHQAFQKRGGDFGLVCGLDNAEVRRVIDLMGFDKIFTIHETMAAAGCQS